MPTPVAREQPQWQIPDAFLEVQGLPFKGEVMERRGGVEKELPEARLDQLFSDD